ncbi:MAG: murein hydrolase activator EnvC family protein [Candidatus Porifericomitaceae bacterium WSBS_2022_MAG_OTU9]
MNKVCAASLLLLLPTMVVAAVVSGVQEAEETELASMRDRISWHEANLHLADLRQKKLSDSLTDYGTLKASNRVHKLRTELGGMKEEISKLQSTAAQVAERLQLSQLDVAATIGRFYRTGYSMLWDALMPNTEFATIRRLAIVDEYIRVTAQSALQKHLNEIATQKSLHRDYSELQQRIEQQEKQLLGILRQDAVVHGRRSQNHGRLQQVVHENKLSLDMLYQQELQLLAQMRHKNLDPEKQHAARDVLQQEFADQKGKLLWPVRGTVRKSKSPSAEADWAGVFIDHQLEQPVQAVSDGRVVFADNFKPIGNMVIIDHGDGFMSLYAHNADTSRRPGDWVAKGDTIASVVEVAATSDSVLYFEIRHHGNPLNPAQWCH